MRQFDEWWQKEEDNILRLLVESDGSVMDDMHIVALQAWGAAVIGAAKTLEERIKKTDHHGCLGCWLAR